MRERVSFLQAGIIIILTLVSYFPAMRGGFIWDDGTLLTENPLIHEHKGLFHIWWGTENRRDYFPLTLTSFWLEWRLWKKNPTGYHVTNVLLHALSSVLIWRVLTQLRIRGAWLAALIFAIHPVCVESVAWISERKNTLSMVFYVLALMLYLKFENHPRRTWYCFSVGAFLLALLSKTSVVMLPVVLLLCAWWQRGGISCKDVLRSIPFFILSGLLSGVTIWFQNHKAIGTKVIPIGGFLDRLAVAGQVVWFYIYKVLLPVNLTMIYPRWEVSGSPLVSFLPDLILIGSFVVFWHYSRTWGRLLLFALGYFVLTLFPVLGFFKMAYIWYSPVADHFQYVAMIGIIALVTGVATCLYDRLHARIRLAIGIIGLVIVGTLSVLSWQQQRIYKDEETLWRDTIAKNPNSWAAYFNLGNVYTHKGRYDQAISDFNKAVEINPMYDDAYHGLGTAYALKGQYDQAISNFNKVIEINPRYADAYHNRGVAYRNKGQYDQAISDFNKVLEINPGYAFAYFNKATVYEKEGRIREAIEAYKGFIQYAPPQFVSYIELVRHRIRELEGK